MGTNRLGLGLALALTGAALVYAAFAMNTGDGMFGGITRRAPVGTLGVVLFVPGAAQIIRGLRDRAKARAYSTQISTPGGRRAALVRLLADIDQSLRDAELLASESDDDTLHRTSKALAELREARRDVEGKLRAE